MRDLRGEHVNGEIRLRFRGRGAEIWSFLNSEPLPFPAQETL